MVFWPAAYKNAGEALTKNRSAMLHFKNTITHLPVIGRLSVGGNYLPMATFIRADTAEERIT